MFYYMCTLNYLHNSQETDINCCKPTLVNIVPFCCSNCLQVSVDGGLKFALQITKDALDIFTESPRVFSVSARASVTTRALLWYDVIVTSVVPSCYILLTIFILVLSPSTIPLVNELPCFCAQTRRR